MKPTTQDDAFVAAMRCIANTVNVITTKDPASQERRGMTATAFCSLTAAPPTVLICINKGSGTHQAIKQSGVFCVNVLSAEQKEIAVLFSSPASPEARFKTAPWSQLASGAPVLDDCVANFDCMVRESIEASTHTIFIGAPVSVRSNSALSPLVYFNREFSALPGCKEPAI